MTEQGQAFDKYSALDTHSFVDNQEVFGFAENDMVSWSWDNPLSTTVVDAKGVATSAQNNDRRGKIIYNLSLSSKANAQFAALAASGKAVPIYVLVKNSAGQEKIASANATVEKLPDGSYGTGVPTRSWSFVAPKLTYENTFK